MFFCQKEVINSEFKSFLYFQLQMFGICSTHFLYWSMIVVVWYKFLFTHKFVSVWCWFCSALMYLVTLMNAWGTQEHACPSCLSRSLFWWSSDRSLELPKISSYRKSRSVKSSNESVFFNLQKSVTVKTV